MLLGIYDYTVVLTYISLGISVFGITRALEGDFRIAIFCLALSGLCDMFDGKIARTKKNRTDDEKSFGIQIDSLCDVVCFGIFPAMICYCLGVNTPAGVAALIFYSVASVIRLAYFNVTETKRQNETSENRQYYQGLPITSMAIILPFLYLMRRYCGLYFLIVIGFFLSLSILKLNTEKSIMSFKTRVMKYSAIVVVTIALGYITSLPSMKYYYDATYTKSNTLSKESQDVINY